MEIGVEERRLAIEAIATLVNHKNVMIELILKPAGVPAAIYKSVLAQQDAVTGKVLSKRQCAPLILAQLGPDEPRVLRRIIEIAAQWPADRYHLAWNEYEARATVYKAREILGTLERMDAHDAEQRQRGAEQIERAQRDESVRRERERATQRRKELDLLLMMFEELVQSSDHQRRGYLLQNLLERLFTLYDVPAYRSFTRNEGGEQIDGAFELKGWYYLAECRWRETPADTRDLDGLLGQINRSSPQTMGFFLSVNSWSEHVVPLLKQNARKSIILMDGYDLRTVLDGSIDLRAFIGAKVAKLSVASEPFLSAHQYLQESRLLGKGA
jgi:hypothetical protein